MPLQSENVNPAPSAVAADGTSELKNIGIKNLGNTCYISAVLQLLVGNAAVVSNIRREAAEVNASEFARHLFRLICDMSAVAEGDVVSPKELIDSLFDHNSKWKAIHKAVQGRQESADEWLQFVLDEVPRLTPCFGFRQRERQGEEIESTILFVDLAPSADVSLSALIHSQYAGKESPGPLPLLSFSDSLVVVIKRWRSSQSGWIAKDNTTFSVSEPLEIFDPNGIKIAEFKLEGFIDHKGTSPHDGHYTTFSRRTIFAPHEEQKWLYFDDSLKSSFKERDHEREVGRSFILMFSHTGNGANTKMTAKLAQEVNQVNQGFRQQQDEDRWEKDDFHIPNDIIAKATEIASKLHLKDLRANSIDLYEQFVPCVIKILCDEFKCTEIIGKQAIEYAVGTENPRLQAGQQTGQQHTNINLPMWNDRENWIINKHIPDRSLVYDLVGRIIVEDPILRDLLSVPLNNTDCTIFIQRPEQSGKTHTIALVAWLSNLCYAQAAYVLLRSGSGASEDYAKFGTETVLTLNKMIWECVVGYTTSGSACAPTYTKLPQEQFDKRIYKGNLPTEPALEGFMKPFVLHSFGLRNDKVLESDVARQVRRNRWPIVFARLCTASNISRAVDHEMETLIHDYGVNKHGFANMTLLNDEYQQNVKAGLRVQEELHQPLRDDMRFFDVLADAIRKETNNLEMTFDDATRELRRRIEMWEDERDDSPSRHDRSKVSACIMGQVRISATIMSGQFTSEDLDLRRVVLLELKVASSYYGHECSAGIDPNKVYDIQFRSSSNLDFICTNGYPDLPAEAAPHLQKFVMDEVHAEVARDGYAHILLQTLGGNNAKLLDIAKFLISFTDTEMPEKPAIAITAYMYTTAGEYPGGPFMVFSEAAMPLRDLIAEIAEGLFVDPDSMSKAPVPSGKVVLHKGSLISKGIRVFGNALQLPKNGSLFLKYVLGLLDGAIERSGFAKENIKVITIGAGLLKVGMTPKTFDHRMCVTLGLISASERQAKNLSQEEICQGLLGRISGSRDGDPYWEARGNTGPPRAIMSGYIKDQQTTYKMLQATALDESKQQSMSHMSTMQGSKEALLHVYHRTNFEGFSDLDDNTKIWNSQTPAEKRKRGRENDANFRVVRAVKGGSTTGVGKSCDSRNKGFLWSRERDAIIQKFESLREDYQELFVTSDNKIMPVFEDTVWKVWNPSSDVYFPGTIMNVRIVQNTDSNNVVSHSLMYTVSFGMDVNGQAVPDRAREVDREFYLDPDMAEWSYENRNVGIDE